MQRTDVWKDPDTGKDWMWEEKGTTEDEVVVGITNSMDMSLSKLQEFVMDRSPGMLQSMGSQRVGHDWVTDPNWCAWPWTRYKVSKRV